MQTLENNNQNSVSEFINDLFFEHTGKRFQNDSPLRCVMEYIDELDYLEIVMFIENHFSIEIDDDEWEEIMNVSNLFSDVIIFVENKLKEQK